MENKKLISQMLAFTCVLFAPLTAITDILIGVIVSKTSLLSLGATFLLLIVDFAISAFLIILRENPPMILEKSKFFSYSCFFYTILSVLLKVSVTIVNLSKKLIWNTTVYSVILVLIFSFVISACILFFNSKSMALKITVYFLVIGIFYYLLTVTIGALDIGNNLILILSTYIIAFTIITVILLLIKSRKKNKARESMPYQKQF